MRTLKRRRIIGSIALVAIAALIVYVESHHAIVAFRTWTFALLFLFLIAAAVVASGALRNAFVVCAALAFGLVVLEGVCDVIAPKNGVTITAGWAAGDPVVGWRPAAPGVIHARKVDPTTGQLIYDADYTIDAHLDRRTSTADDGPAVAFFGDSYTFGDGLNDPKTLPQQFADLFEGKQKTVNLGVNGYSPQQFLREVETGYKDDVTGKAPAAFVFLTSSFHAARTSCKEPWTATAPRYALVDDKVVLAGICQQGVLGAVHEWLGNSAAYRMFVRPLRTQLTHDDITLYIRILAEAVRVSREKYGVETLVPYLKFRHGYLDGTGYDDAAIERDLSARGVHVIDMTLKADPTKGIVVTIPGDGHPTAYANQIRAAMIRDELARMGVKLAQTIQ